VKKRKQHFVWEHYLAGWTNGGNLWCQMAGRRFPVAPANIAHERDFYRLKELSDVDISYLEALAAKPTIPMLRKLAQGWVRAFRRPFELQRAYLATGRKDPAIEQELDIAINNLEEDLHSNLEGQAVRLLAALKAGDDGIASNDGDYMLLARYLAAQFMRTPRMQRIGVEASSELPNFNCEAAWGLMRTIFATNIGWSLYADRAHNCITFLAAADTAELITADQPIVNTKGASVGGDPPEGLELYYPLSPTKALLLTCDSTAPGATRRQLSHSETVAYNRLLVAASEQQIYAATERALTSLGDAEEP
jgi:hypothetical protein